MDVIKNDKAYMLEHNCPDLRDFGFDFCQERGHNPGIYRHKDCPEIFIDAGTTCSKDYTYLKLGIFFEDVKLESHYSLGHVIEDSLTKDWFFYPSGNPFTRTLTNWACQLVMATAVIGTLDKKLDLPSRLDRLKKLKLKYGNSVEIILTMTESYLSGHNEHRHIVDMKINTCHCRFTFHKIMDDAKEFNPDGINRWFNRIQRWFMDNNNPIDKTAQAIINAGNASEKNLRDNITHVLFKDVDVSKPFFDSFREEYDQFDEWVSLHPYRSCLIYNNGKEGDDGMFGFLAFEHEEDVNDIDPALKGPWIKISTLKTEPQQHGIGSALMRKLREMLPEDTRFYLTTKSADAWFEQWLHQNNFRKHCQYHDEVVYVSDGK